MMQIYSGYNAWASGVLCMLAGVYMPLYGQSWQSLQTWGGIGDESVEAIVRSGDGAYWVGGGFQGRLQVGRSTWDAQGQEDIYIASHRPGRIPKGVLHLGGAGEDVLSALVATPSGGFVCGGEFWEQLVIPGGDTLWAERNPKALFLGSFDADGGLLWAKKIEGGGLKALKSMALAEDGLYLSGFFSDTLAVDSLLLASGGSSDAFLIKLDVWGRVLWGRRLGAAGDVRATALAVGPLGPVLAGNYNQRVAIGDTVFTANTRDWDVFIAAFTPGGGLRWGRKAGGVYDDEAFDLGIGPDGGIYVCGQVVGVMRLGPNLEIQSQDGNADGFVVKYRIDGTPEWAKTIAGEGVQSAYRLHSAAGGIAVLGYYRGNLTWAGQQIASRTVFNGFLALMDERGNERTLIPLPGDTPVFPGALETDGQGGWVIGGSYGGPLHWDGLRAAAPVGGFDAFAAVWGTTINTALEPAWAAGLRVYPNPAREKIWVDVPGIPYLTLRLYDTHGRELCATSGSHTLDIPPLPSGVYVLEIGTGLEKVWRQVVMTGW